MKKIKIASLITLLVIIGAYFIYTEGSLAVDKNNQGSVLFTVNRGEGLKSIIKRLAAEDLIRNKVVFYVISYQQGIDKKIQAGEFKLSKSMNAKQIATTLTHGSVDEWVTIVEGLRKEEVAQKLASQFSFSEIDFIEQAREGQLFPDTYLIPKTASLDAILSIMEGNFQKKMAEARTERPYEKRSDRDILILASLVEREAKFADDRQLVASIILKRALNDWPLQLDATIQYALGYQKREKTWWKRDLTLDDLKVDSTYNTYTRKGLPPAPICNPGLESIKAAIKADPNTPYWYYVNDKNGKIHPAVTNEEHEQNKTKYIE